MAAAEEAEKQAEHNKQRRAEAKAVARKAEREAEKEAERRDPRPFAAWGHELDELCVVGRRLGRLGIIGAAGNWD